MLQKQLSLITDDNDDADNIDHKYSYKSRSIMITNKRVHKGKRTKEEKRKDKKERKKKNRAMTYP